MPFYPRPDLRARLRNESQGYSPGRAFPLFDVRWDDGSTRAPDPDTGERFSHDCLCIFERHKSGQEKVFRVLVDEEGEPRQINESDVKEALDNILTRTRWAREWETRLKEKESAQKADAAKSKEDRLDKTMEELERVASRTSRPLVFGYGESDTSTNLASEDKFAGLGSVIIDPRTGWPIDRKQFEEEISQ